MRCLAYVLFAVFLGACHVKGGIVHRVQRGESLLQISHAYEVPIEEILYANSLQDPDRLKEGDKLLIPGVRKARPVKKFVWEKMVPSAQEPEKAPKVSKAKPKPKEKEPGPGDMKFIWPAKGRLLVPFGMQGGRMHNGIDLSLTPGQAIQAGMQGTVVYRGEEVDGYGKMLILRHSDNVFSVYAYLGRFNVEKGSTVRQGEVIAHASERKNFAFIHFEIRRGKHAVDPLKFLPKK